MAQHLRQSVISRLKYGGAVVHVSTSVQAIKTLNREILIDVMNKVDITLSQKAYCKFIYKAFS